jgi:hypothetical protein
MRYSTIIVGTDGSESLPMDLIVGGNRGIETLSGRLLGSVPSDVSHRASCDVLILHTMKGGPRNPREQR